MPEVGPPRDTSPPAPGPAAWTRLAPPCNRSAPSIDSWSKSLARPVTGQHHLLTAGVTGQHFPTTSHITVQMAVLTGQHLPATGQHHLWTDGIKGVSTSCNKYEASTVIKTSRLYTRLL
jgi:hypothetical protein